MLRPSRLPTPRSYHTAKEDSTPRQIAAAHGIPVELLIWMNRRWHRELGPSSRLMRNTELIIPGARDIARGIVEAPDTDEEPEPQYYYAEDNDCLGIIAEALEVEPQMLFEMNKPLLPGLSSVRTKLQYQTPVRVPQNVELALVAYCTYP